MLPGSPPVDFTLNSIVDGKEEVFTLSQLKGSYVLLVFYPVDFGYVTPAEFYALDNILPRLKQLNCEVVAVSTEHIDSIKEWWRAPRSHSGLQEMKIRMCSDPAGRMAIQPYNCLKDDENVAFRCNFLLDPEGKVIFINKCDLPVGTDVTDILSCLEAAEEIRKKVPSVRMINVTFREEMLTITALTIHLQTGCQGASYIKTPTSHRIVGGKCQRLA